jgi:hypothetical protein
MIIGLPQSMIFEVSRACRAIMPAGAGLGRVCALIDERRGGELPQFQPGHPLGCHRRRVPGRVVFEHVVAALVHGSGYERIASPGCSDRTICRRLAEWAELAWPRRPAAANGPGRRRWTGARAVLTARLSGHRVMINGNALVPPLSCVAAIPVGAEPRSR